jgi:two-component system, cell cycle sensor histidine kinase and response regulator CckA
LNSLAAHGSYNDLVPRPASKRVAFETARLSLARHKLQGDDCRTAASAHAALVSSVALQIERVGIWRFDAARTELRCACLYTRSTGSFGDADEVRSARDFPAYFAALRERRAIVASDARGHRTTRELREAYLEPHGITSLLDTPVFLDGEVVGVVCHEHVGAPREFEQHEVDFASSVADMVAMVDEQSQRLALEIELRQQDQLRQQLGKLEALGRLARAAAHDFNNALSMIMIAAEPLTAHADPAVAAKGKLLLDASDLGARIAKDLLVLGRDAPVQTTSVRLDLAIEALLPLLRARFGPLFTLSVQVVEPTVRADPSQIERMVLNLATNAAEALPQSDAGPRQGRVELVLRSASEDEAHGPAWLVLEVRDDGVGMNDHVKSHLFEPYFTTKPNGTGVGLASVYGIVRQLGGRIQVESELHTGSRFIVILPGWV